MGHKLLVIDTETGGLDPSRYSILSLGAVVWEGGALGETFEVFVAEPDPAVEPEAMGVNGIDLAWLKEHGAAPREAVGLFQLFVERNFGGEGRGGKIQLAGHNVSFDVGFLKRLYRLAGSGYDEVFSHRLLDTASVINFLIVAGRLPPGRTGLGPALKHFGIEVEAGRRHTALGDALATARLLNKTVELVRGAGGGAAAPAPAPPPAPAP